MGEKRHLKALLLLLILGVILLFSSSFAQADKCCVRENPYTCKSIALDEECDTDFGWVIKESSCDSFEDCDEVCCCDLGVGNKFQRYGECNDIGSYYFILQAGVGSDTYCEALCSGEITDDCPYTVCQEENTGQCWCGSIIADGGTYCCGADSGISSSQGQCEQSPSCAPDTLFSVSGRVKDSDGPLAGVTLSAGGKTALSQSDGTFTISNLPAGTGQIVARFFGYETAYENYEIISSDLTGILIILTESLLNENCDYTINERSNATWDNDNDGCLAKYDSDCMNHENEGERNLCSDSVDNDCDGYFDCFDDDCAGSDDCTTSPTHTYCGDGQVDYPNFYGTYEECEEDSGCQSGQYCDECKCIDETTSVCGDGIIEAGEDCDPAASDTDPLWVCDGNTQICDEISCKCRPITGECGDAFLERPSEECEFNGVGGVLDESYCGYEQCIQPGQPGECLCRTATSCGNGIAEPVFNEECDGDDADGCASETCNTGDCTCADCSNEDKRPVLSDSISVDTITLQWYVVCPDSPSNEIDHFEVGRCKLSEGENPCTPDFFDTVSSSTFEYAYPFSDEDLLSGTNYCFDVTSVYQSESRTSKNIVCTNNPVFECNVDEPDDYWCSSDDKVMKCEGGQNIIVEDCPSLGDYICIDYPYDSLTGQNTMCVYKSMCEICNGWYSMFSSVNSHITEYRGGNSLCSLVPSCYIDYTKTSVDKYYSCEDVDKCYDYTSEEACIGLDGVEGDKCGVGQCEWKPSKRFSELGIGVCKPTDKEKEDCTLCDSISLNNLYGSCTEDLCVILGDCWYDDPAIGNFNFGGDTTPQGSACIHKRNMACQFYDNDEDCIGYDAAPTNSSIDNTWTDENPLYPYSGTNKHIQKSNDYFDMGLCIWGKVDEFGSYDGCFKDGDGDISRDCFGNDHVFECMSDINPPASTISFTNPVKKDLDMAFSFVDDVTISGNKLYFNIVPLGDECYPDYMNTLTVIELEDEQVFGVITYDMDESGNYTFCWFGEDGYNNFEEVHEATLEVDAELPQVDYEKTERPFEIPWSYDDYIWRTNLTLMASLNETAYCSLWLTKTGESGFVAGIKIVDRFDSFFEITYTYIEDGEYTFHAECKDVAGNINTNPEFSFKLDADKHITDLGPDSTFGLVDEIDEKINIVLKANTSENAECRFSGEEPDNFEEMTPFDNTGGSLHRHSLIFNSTQEGIKQYHVRCNYTEKNKVFGNSGDVITFAIDYSPPTTTFVNSQGAQISVEEGVWYRSSYFDDVYLKCEDFPMYFDNNPDEKNWASGCDEVQYSYNPPELNPQSTGLNTSLIKDGMENGFNYLMYRSVDAVGNYEDTNGPKLIKMDDEGFSFDFILYKYVDGRPVNVDTVTWDRTYYVDIKSSKSTPEYHQFPESYWVDIDNTGYYIGGRVYSFANITEKENPFDDRIHQWIATIKLSKSDKTLNGLDGDATGEFFITAIDSHGIASSNISSGGIFYIDTTPPDVPAFDPPFEGEFINNFEQYYGDLFNEYNGSYYTNDQNLFVTGKSNERGMVYFYLNDVYNISSTYDQSQNADEDGISYLQVIQEQSDGDSLLVFDGDVTDVYKFGYYLMVEGLERINYTHYHEYYTITDSSVKGPQDNQITDVEISPPLEFDIEKESENVFVYNALYPHNWFGVGLNLTLAWNTLSAKMVDPTGNKALTPTYDIYYDPYPPLRLSFTPFDDVIIAEDDAPVKVILTEQGAGLQDDTIIMKINGLLVDTTTSFEEEIMDIEGERVSKFTYTITYPHTPFEDGVYEVYFEAKDMAANDITITWSFEIDTDVPSDPEFALVGVDKSEHYADEMQTWFTNEVVDFTLEFSQDNATVVIDAIDLNTVSYNGGGSPSYHPEQGDVANCTLNAKNSFICSFNDIDAVSADDDYALKILAYKILNDSQSEKGLWYKMFTMDTITPSFTLYFDNSTNSNANVTFKAVVSTQEKMLRAEILIEGEDLVELIPIEGNTGYEMAYLWNKPFDFNWDVPDKASEFYNFTFYLRDMAGNEYSNAHMILIDNVIPEISVDNITTHPRWIRELNPYQISDISDIAYLLEENARFAGNGINIIGSIVPTYEQGNNKVYDIKQFVITKRNSEGELHDPDEAPLTLSRCNSKGKQENCFIEDKFYINDYFLEGEYGYDTPNYILFEIEDESENIAYFTLVLVSDLTEPREPEIIII